jgi:hypothetical protein
LYLIKLPSQYKEENNKSFKKNLEFVPEEVRKLVSNDVIEEVGLDKVLCINPLSMAANKKGKRRLCIDLSRHLNESCRAKKFRVGVSMILQKWSSRGRGSSAFHHIPEMEKHRKFLGFEVVMEGEAKLYRFKAMPFGYKGASRILIYDFQMEECTYKELYTSR